MKAAMKIFFKDLNETKQMYNSLKNKTDIENSRLMGLTNLYETKLKELTKNEKELKYKAKLEAEKIIKDANRLVEKTIKEIRENKLSPKEIKTEFKDKAEKITSIEQFETETIDHDGNIVPGDLVRIVDSNSSGEVIEITNEIASVNINGHLKKQDLRSGKIKKRTCDRISRIYEREHGRKELSLDLRGKYTEEINEMLTSSFMNQTPTVSKR